MACRPASFFCHIFICGIGKSAALMVLLPALKRAQLVVGFLIVRFILAANTAGGQYCRVHGDKKVVVTIPTSDAPAATPATTGRRRRH